MPVLCVTMCLCFLFLNVVRSSDAVNKSNYVSAPTPDFIHNTSRVVFNEIVRHFAICGVFCHRSVKCKSYSYRTTTSECTGYDFNACVSSLYGITGNVTTTFKADFLYYCNPDQPTLDTSGRTYQIFTQQTRRLKAVQACKDLGMMLLVVTSTKDLDFLTRVTSPIINMKRIWVGAGQYIYEGVERWWDGGSPPHPLLQDLVSWDVTQSYSYKGVSYSSESGTFIKSYGGRLFHFICEM